MPSVEPVLTEAAVLAETIEATIAAAEQELTKVTLDEFISNKIGMFGKLIGEYARLFESCGVHSREELDELVRRQVGQPGSRQIFSAMEHLLDMESEWDHFVLDLDGRLGSDGRQPPPLLSPAPCSLQLTDALSGEPCRLADTPGTRLLVLLRHFA
ncbi:uncharacterized protein LOC122366710 [Amphibalanus amphitrite]|uniref:uncharacterized protein LOC122366710 n=1 Tax=Amphibalanus amphitrite TaxID=1232801 RepID=UPI001C921732|nr:uncharacterized protein LOC122366710 [Amphibalanus amphitrite]XP_043195164.1 uncharacterized protein LOC122366710 [Amphibalanus amphitrite]XP_043195165.1 uncharacterized protein LOC122366710 [Amphibalanus amphitrite]XP_043195166.1 uncharacterized protein LOC122366710 [Amphibalanus amphitrite]XP_043195167.1 uncharacterized protein LOC122366710 [Amphibalanus amphitrite]XP_043195168.1 uncharacterized protein LOC122366710 [Amphibalanus amphitrite]